MQQSSTNKNTQYEKKITSELWIAVMLWGVIGQGHLRNGYGSKQFLTGSGLRAETYIGLSKPP